MRDETWDRIMEQARHEARVNLDRRKVVAVQVGDRAARITGSRWAYVVQCGSECTICASRRTLANMAIL